MPCTCIRLRAACACTHVRTRVQHIRARSTYTSAHIPYSIEPSKRADTHIHTDRQTCIQVRVTHTCVNTGLLADNINNIFCHSHTGVTPTTDLNGRFKAYAPTHLHAQTLTPCVHVCIHAHVHTFKHRQVHIHAHINACSLHTACIHHTTYRQSCSIRYTVCSRTQTHIMCACMQHACVYDS